MKINEIEKRTGLTKKAIRLYEEKGLLSVTRSNNSYREYTKENMQTLMKIKKLRSAGFSLSDIKLYIEGFVTLDSLIYKKLYEIEISNERTADASALLKNILTNGLENTPQNSSKPFFNEEDDVGKKAIGIDIGTTTISASVIDLDGHISQVYAIENDSAIKSSFPFEKKQSVDAIMNKVIRIIDSFIELYPSVCGIGITGQMHGIVYIDKNQNAVSDLITWQDERANELFNSNQTYTEIIRSKTGTCISAGFGFATHFYNIQNNLVPPKAVSFCTIADYIVSRLAGSNIVVHAGNAASFGLYDLERKCFREEALKALNITDINLPEVTWDNITVGTYKEIPVACAIGDNQASFFGSVREEKNSILVNYGTGSQISVLSDTPFCGDGIETRPYINGKYLLCGAALCGGRAYAVLEQFFSDYVYETLGVRQNQYAAMNSLAEKYIDRQNTLKVISAFCGTRDNPKAFGSILNISESNFTPGEVILGFLYAMADELHEMFEKMPSEGISNLIASGNAVKKNPVFENLLSRVYGMPLYLTTYNEEAAVGAALYALLCIGMNEKEIKKHIKYTAKDR